MNQRILSRCINPALAAALAVAVSTAVAQPRFGNPSPTAGSETSQRANESADQAIYKPVEYMNVNKKGPALIVIPGEIKSSNATFLQKFTSNNIADFARDRALRRQLPGARALEPRTAAQGIRARLQPRRPADQARKYPGHGQAQEHEVRRQVRHPEDRAGRRRAAGLRRPRARPDRRAPRRASAARAAARSAGAVGQARPSARCRPANRRGVWIIGMRYKIINAETTEQVAQGYTEEKMEVGAKSSSVLGVSQSQQGGVSLDTMVQRLVQKIGVGNRQQVQVATPLSSISNAGRVAGVAVFGRGQHGTNAHDHPTRQIRNPARARPRRDGRRLRGVRPDDQAPRRAEDDPPRPARGRTTGRRRRALSPRGAGGGPAQSSEHRLDLRLRRGRRHVVHRDGVRRRPRAQGVLRRRRALPSRRHRADHDADPRRARVLAPAGRRSPRHQAGEHLPAAPTAR